MGDMGKTVEWDFALELSGITPDDLPMARLAEYMLEWAAMLGKDSRPVFKGIVKGSALLRAAVPPLEQANVSARVRNAANDGDAARYLGKIESMLAADGIRRAKVTDRQGAVLATVFPLRNYLVDEITVLDVADIDGRVVRVEGRDRTAHIGLVEYGTGRSISLQTVSDDLAQRLARHFRGGWLRVHTEGTWTRTVQGKWEPKNLSVLDFEELDAKPALEIMRELRDAPWNAWAQMPLEQALAQWREIRGIDEDADASEDGS